MNKITPLKVWAQKVLPTIYDDSLSYYELLNKIIAHVNLMGDVINSFDEQYETPMVVTKVSDMTNKYKVYIYLGNETGYTLGDWYYYNEDTESWTSGGGYGGYPVDNALDSDSVNAVQNRVVTNKINQMVNDIDNITNDVNGINDDITSIRNDINSIQLKNFVKVITIGDSYGTGTGGGLSVTPWPERLAGRFGLGYGTDLKNFSYGGRSFGANNGEESNPDTGANFCDGLRKAVNSLTASQREDITDIIVGGGINDWSHNTTQIWTGMANFKNIRNTYFPNAKMHIVIIGNALVPQYRVPYYRDIIRYYHQYGTRADFTVYECYKHLICNKAYMHTDGVHITDTAQQIITDDIYNVLTGGNAFDNQYRRIPFTSDIGDGIAWFDGNNINIKFNSTIKTFGTPVSIGTGWGAIGNIQSNLINGGSAEYGQDPFTVFCTLRDSGTYYPMIGLQIRFRHDPTNFDNVIIQARNTSYWDGTALKTFSSVSSILPLDNVTVLNPVVN